MGATPVLGPIDLPAVLAGFHRRYPGVALALRTGLVADLLSALDTGEVNLVVGPIHADLADRYVAHRLEDEHVVLALPPEHRLAGRAGVDLTDVRAEPFVCLPAGSGLRTILLTAAAAAGFEPRIPFETDTPAGVRALVVAGLGVALLARSAARAPGPPVAVHDLPSVGHQPIGVIHHRDRGMSAAAAALYRRLDAGEGGAAGSGRASA